MINWKKIAQNAYARHVRHYPSFETISAEKAYVELIRHLTQSSGEEDIRKMIWHIMAVAEKVGVCEKAYETLAKSCQMAILPDDTTWSQRVLSWTQCLVNSYFGKAEGRLLPIRDTMLVSVAAEMFALADERGYPIEEALSVTYL